VLLVSELEGRGLRRSDYYTSPAPYVTRCRRACLGRTRGSSTVHDVPDHEALVRSYGPWRARSPRDAAALLEGYAGCWWIAGGWAIEAFTHRGRPHDDVDPSIPRSDVAVFHQHVSGRLDVWQADDGTLRPMAQGDEALPDTCENLWLRQGTAQPWEYDVILMETTSTTWTFKRDARISLPVEQILWESDGIAYLRPEVQLLHQARGLRPKDQADFDACAPLLEPTTRARLRTAVSLADPGHPWLAELEAASRGRAVLTRVTSSGAPRSWRSAGP
jgi:hypothetical protein